MQNEKVPYAAWIGIDWGSDRHAVCLQPAEPAPMQHYTLEQNPEALHEWFACVCQRFAGRTVAVAIEQSKGAVINFLLGLDFVHIFRIHPKSLKNYREALHPSGAKDDPTDAELLISFARGHQDRIQRWVPEQPQQRLLLRLVELRRKTVNKRVRLTNELTQLLKEHFPQALAWAGPLHKVMACDFLSRWPTLQKLQRSKPAAVRKFYLEHGSRNRALLQERLEQMRAARPLTTDPAVIASSVLAVRSIVGQLRTLISTIEELDDAIEEIWRQQPDAQIFSSFPGAGPALAPRLQAVMGTDRNRFDSSQQVAEYSGVAPVTERSGHKQWVHRRLACAHFVKQSFHEYAAQSLGHCPWAYAYYQYKRAAGMRHHAAVRALAYKWIRIIFRCWKDGVPYDERKYLEALNRRAPAWLKASAIAA